MHFILPYYSLILVPLWEMIFSVSCWCSTPIQYLLHCKVLYFSPLPMISYTHCYHRTDHSVFKFIISISSLTACPLKYKNLYLFTALEVFSSGADEWVSKRVITWYRKEWIPKTLKLGETFFWVRHQLG